MAFTIKRRVYESIPVPLKRLACAVPFSWWAGRAYRETLARGAWFDQASRSDVLAYQERELGRTLRFAAEHVPAYRPMRRAVEHFPPFDALKEFPLLDKETVQQSPDQYLPDCLDTIPHYVSTTGGTTGNQLKILLDDHSQSIEIAFQHRQWARMGYTSRHRKATFRGVAMPFMREGTFWQHNPIYNELQFSPFHMSEQNLGKYIEALVQFKPNFLHGYPSALDILAEYVVRHELASHMPHIMAALLGSEGALPSQRERIEAAFHTRAFSWYGHSERVILAGECEHSSTYHHFPDYGWLEIHDDQGNPCDEEGQRGELAGTGFYNRCMPLIRYRTGDFATRLAPQCACGRQWDRFHDVEGRWRQDMLIGRTGARISIAALNMHGPMFDRVIRYQYFQDKSGYCTIRVMAAPGFSKDDEMAIRNAFQAKTKEEIIFGIELVEDIPLTARGKLRLLDSQLNSGPQVPNPQ